MGLVHQRLAHRAHSLTAAPMAPLSTFRRRGPAAKGALALASFAVLLSACGGSSGTASDNPAITPTTSAPIPSDTALVTPTDTASPSGSSSPSESASPTNAVVSSFTVAGTQANPTITVKGSGFGEKPAPDPATNPAGQMGCPKVANAVGFLYGNNLYFSDTKAAKGSKNWTAGQNSGGQFDCIGLVIDSWTDSNVVFHPGSTYGKPIKDNMYYLSAGDPVEVDVKGAKATGVAQLSS